MEDTLDVQDGDTIPDFILDSDEDICLQVDLEYKDELQDYDFQKFANRIVELDLSKVISYCFQLSPDFRNVVLVGYGS